VVLAKFMPIANVNRIVFVNNQSVSQFCTTRQPISVWRRFAIIPRVTAGNLPAQ